LNYDKVIPKPLADAVTMNGHRWVVPLNMHIQNILYYDKKLLDELKLQPPTSFDELLKVANAVKKAKPNVWPLGCRHKGEVRSHVHLR